MVLPFIEIIEWISSDPNLLMWKFPDEDREIKNGAQLTVRETQQALLVNEGIIADGFGPGRHGLSTRNIPLLTRLKGWKHGFESPFKADVYFFNIHSFLDLRWGTPAPVMLRDPQFGQVRLRAFGAYNVRIADAATFFRQYAGTYRQLYLFELERQLRDFIAPRFGEALAAAGIAAVDIAGSITDISERITPLLRPLFEELGLELLRFQVTSATLPDEVNVHYDKVTSMNMVADMDRFHRFSAASALAQPGSVVNQGAQAGFMLAAMQQSLQTPPPAAAAPAQDDIAAKLARLKALLDAGLIDETDYRAKKTELLAGF